MMNRFLNRIATMVLIPLLFLLNGCNSEDVFSDSNENLVRIDLVASPVTTRGMSSLTLAEGNEQPFEAVAHYADGSSQVLKELGMSNWYTSDKNIGHFKSPGIFVGDASGSTVVTVEKDGITSNAVDITVTDAVITAIQVTPATVNLAKGQTERLIATATYSDGSSSQIPHSVTWASLDTKIVTVDSTGLLSGIAPGTTNVTATQNGITSNAVSISVTEAVIIGIQVSPATVNLAKGQHESLTAIATYSDGTSSNVTRSVTWGTTAANIASLISDGQFSGLNVGSTVLTATKDGITSNAVNVSVTEAVISTIQITPATIQLAKGQTEPLTAIATYSDGSSSNITNSVTWTPVDTNTATVTTQGSLLGVNTGSTTVAATKDGITSNIITVSVTEATITAIQITPATLQLAKGQTAPLTAIAIYSDGSSSNVTSSVTWTPVDSNITTITPDGQLFGVNIGTTSITATKDGITSNTASVSITEAVLSSIQVTPATVNVAKGQTEPLTATATYSDGTSSNITHSVSWMPVNTDIVTVDATTGLLSGDNLGSTTVTAAKDGITSNTVNVSVTDAVITAIQVTPAIINVAKGQTEQLTASAIYSDGSSSDITNSVTWTPVDSNISTVTSAGLLSGVNLGVTSLIAKKEGISSNTVNINVTEAVLSAIQVTPSPVNLAKGQTEQLVATATYSDGTSSNITNSVTWTSVDNNIATITPAGLLASVDLGSTTLSAAKEGITSNTVEVFVTEAVLTAIQVTPSPINIAKGQTELLTATATYSDGTSSNVTSSVTWTQVDTNVATITASGQLFGVDVGVTTITATKEGIDSNAVSVNISEAVITLIDVTPTTASVAKGQTEPLTATAIYSDGTSSNITNSVTWVAVDTNIATITATGQLFGVDVGSTTVSAQKESITSNTVDVNVTEAVITSIDVTPVMVSIAKGQTEALIATATYSDNTLSDVTNSVAWTSINIDIVTVTSAGDLFGVNVGTTTVTATKEGVSSNAVNVNVTEAVITDISVSPSAVSVAKGQSESLTATATYSDETSSNVTNSVTWALVDTDTATVTSSGLLSGVEVGNTTLTAIKEGISSATVNITVTEAVVIAIQISPDPVNIAKGQTIQLTAAEAYSDGTSIDVTSTVIWTPVDTNIATVSSSGLLSAIEVGTTTLTAATDDFTSDPVNVSVCADLGGTCIDLFDIGGGKLFTSTPSVSYLDSISDTAGTSYTYHFHQPEGVFYQFVQKEANELCDTYNTSRIGGRTNWRLPEKDELKGELFDRFGNMYDARGWPAASYYSTGTLTGSRYYSVRLSDGYVVTPSDGARFVSCVSEP